MCLKISANLMENKIGGFCYQLICQHFYGIHELYFPANYLKFSSQFISSHFRSMFALFHCFSFINAAIEMYLHLCKISMRKIFSEAVNYFSQKSSAIDVLQGPGYASELLLQNHEKHCDHYCVKSDQIRSYFWSVFSCIRTKYLRLQSEYRKIWTRNNSAFGHFSGSACGVFA